MDFGGRPLGKYVGQLPRPELLSRKTAEGSIYGNDIAFELLTSAFISDRHSMRAAEKGQEPLSRGEDALSLIGHPVIGRQDANTPDVVRYLLRQPGAVQEGLPRALHVSVVSSHVRP